MIYPYRLILFAFLFHFAFNHSAVAGEPLKQITTNQKLIAFTFDDGPNDGTTRQIMELFENEDGHATFFNVGKNVEGRKELVLDVIKRGHEIGNHSMNHQNLVEIDDMSTLAGEIKDFQELYQTEFNYQPVLFRAPFLKSDDRVERILEMEDLTLTSAALFANDASASAKAEDIAEKINNNVAPGAIILCHERQHTIDALKTVIPQLSRDGYKFVTVSELVQQEGGWKNIGINIPDTKFF